MDYQNKPLVEKISKRCSVKHTPVCKFLGSDGCEKCSLYKGDVKDFERQKTNDMWEVTQSNMAFNADLFHDSETCLFCKQRPGNPKEVYGTVELAHPEPAYEKGMIFGLGTPRRAEVGSLIPFPIAMCKRCKKLYSLAENVKLYSATVGFIIGLVTLLLMSGWEVIKYSPEYIPLVYILFVMAIVYAIGSAWAKRIVQKNRDQMHFHVFDIPEMKEMEELGWFVYREEQNKTRLQISKKKPREHFRFFSFDPRQPGDE